MKNLSSALIRNFLGILILGALGLLASCSSSTEVLTVRQFHLKSVDPADRDANMVRGEQMYRLRGAVTLEEREARLGQYYTVSWKDATPSSGSMELVMDYQQASTGSKTLRMRRDLPAGQTSGQVEFKITGQEYQIGGRVLAWRIRLMRGSSIVAEKRSYLWR